MNHQALKTLMALGEPYSPDTDAERLAWLKVTVTVHGLNSITYEDRLVWGADGARARKVFEAATSVRILYEALGNGGSATDNTGLTNGQKSDLLEFSRLLSAPVDIDMSRSELRTILNSIDEGVVISNPDKNAFLALADGTLSRWEAGRQDDGPRAAVFFPPMGDPDMLDHIAQARALP